MKNKMTFTDNGYVPLNARGCRERSFDVKDDVTVRDYFAPTLPTNIGGSEWAVTKIATYHQNLINLPSHYH